MSCLMFDDEAVAGLMPDKQYVTLTGTTDSSGVLVSSYTASDFIVISAISAGSVITPFVNSGYAWRFKVTDQNANPKTNTSVTIYAYYI